MPVDQNSLTFRACGRGVEDYKAGRPNVCPEEFAATEYSKQSYHGGYDMAREHDLEKGS